MNKIWIILKREYRESVFKKSFIIITLLTPLIMIGLSVLPTLLMFLSSEKTERIDVIDQSHSVYNELTVNLKDTLKNKKPKFIFKQVFVGNKPFDRLLSQEQALIENEQIDGLLFIPSTVEDSGKVEYYSKNVADLSLNHELRNAIRKIVMNHRIVKSGLDPRMVQKLIRPVEMKTVKIVKGGRAEERGFIQEYFSTFIFVMILYFTLIMYGASIMRSVVQEKTSRVIEVLLSGSTPFQLMTGKIIGQGLVGFTQYLIWAVFGIGLILFGSSSLPGVSQYLNFSPMTFVYFVIFFILGYFLFSTLYAAVGAVSNNDQEAQQMSMPIILLLIVPIIFNGYIVKSPDSSLSVFLSIFPTFSPIIMFARINLSNPPIWQIVSSILLLVLTILFSIWIVARIYRVGILMYGKRPTLPEIMKWLKN